MSNPSEQAKQLMSTLSGLLKQAQQDPDSVQIDIGQAREIKDALANLVTASEQGGGEGGGKEAKGGKGGKQGKSSMENGDDDDEKDSSQKKSPSY
jgi:hypothetical protein